MALYALGYLSRYHPETWNPFVEQDQTGERLFIEKLFDVAARYVPNLILNRVKGQRVQFVYETEDVVRSPTQRGQ